MSYLKHSDVASAAAATRMFISHPTYEFPVPVAWASDERHWRIIELNLELPWFILSIERRDANSDATFVQSYCFAWDDDLAAFLQTVDHGFIRGLVCMAPGRKSVSGHWTSHEVSEVWLAHDEDGIPFLELIGVDGQLLDVGIRSQCSTPSVRRAVLLKQKRRKRRRAAVATRRASGKVEGSV